MHNVLIAGAGKIGSLITCLLCESGDYHVTLIDKDFSGSDINRIQGHLDNFSYHVQDTEDSNGLKKIIKDNNIKAVISSLPYFCNVEVAKVAKETNIAYFDLTEDTEVTKAVSDLAQDSQNAFVPQCGLAPGFISIVANDLIQHFDSIEKVNMRVGALPQNPNNALHYAINWSIDGLINEYGNTCYGIEDGELTDLMPLEGLERIQLDGMTYEAFNTSGGLGSLVQTYAGKVNTLNYKTIRYPGHCKKVRFLMNDLKLNFDRDTLRRILMNAIPKTYQDMVLVYVSVSGMQNGELIEETYVNKVYPQKIAGQLWSAIQVTTASGITFAIDTVLNNPEKHKGLVLQEDFSLDALLKNRFGRYYA